MSAFTKLTQAAVEALRYRGEDVEKSLTKNTVKEVRVALCFLMQPVLSTLILYLAYLPGRCTIRESI